MAGTLSSRCCFPGAIPRAERRSGVAAASGRGRHNVGGGRDRFKATALYAAVWAPGLCATGCQQRQHLFVRPPGAVGVDRLDADMVGAGVPVLLDALADRLLGAPGDIGVDEAVGAAARQIVAAKAEPRPVIDVIVE